MKRCRRFSASQRAGGTVYAISLAREGGAWKVASLAAAPSSVLAACDIDPRPPRPPGLASMVSRAAAGDPGSDFELAFEAFQRFVNVNINAGRR